MRHPQCKLLALAICSFVMIGLAGCGSKEEPVSTETEKPTKVKKEKKNKNKTESASASTGGQKKLIPTGTGVLKGRVTLAGDAPDTKALTAKLLEQINQKPSDKEFCLSGKPSEKEEQQWRIGENKGVENVVVFLIPESGTAFDISDTTPGVEAVKGKDAVLDQPHCAFVPHTLVVFPRYTDAKTRKTVPTGQTFVVKNDAKIAHNTKYGDDGRDNPGDNLTIKPGDSIKIPALKPSLFPVIAQCGIHPWMSANILVRDNPFYAITDKDGNFEIKNVPVGEVHILAWHEVPGYFNEGGAKGEKLTLDEKGGTKDFTIKAK